MKVNHQKIKELRKGTGLSMMNLANRIKKVSHNTLFHCEKEGYKPTIRTMEIIAEYYKVDINSLIED